MTRRSLRMCLGGVALLAATLWFHHRRARHHDVHRRYLSEVVACDANTAILRWTGPDGDAITRTARDGRELWSRQIQGEPEVRALHVTSDAVYVRFSRDAQTDGDRWLERIDLDGNVRWKHLLATREEESDFVSIAEPLVVQNTLIEPVWAKARAEWRAFDTRTGWPLWSRDAGPRYARASVDGAQIVLNDGTRWTSLNVVDGSTRTLIDVADGCVQDDELLLIRPREPHDILVGLPELDLGKRHIVAVLSNHDDADHATVIAGCAKYGNRNVLVLQTFTPHGSSSSLLETGNDDRHLLLETQLPPIAAEESPLGLWNRPGVISGTLPRFTVIGLDDEGSAASFGILDLESGRVVWKARQLGDVRIHRDGALWIVHVYLRDAGTSAVIAIDGDTGTITGSAVDLGFQVDPTAVAAGTFWTKNIDELQALAVDARTLRPSGIRAHIVSAFVRSYLRPLHDNERHEIGL